MHVWRACLRGEFKALLEENLPPADRALVLITLGQLGPARELLAEHPEPILQARIDWMSGRRRDAAAAARKVVSTDSCVFALVTHLLIELDLNESNSEALAKLRALAPEDAETLLLEAMLAEDKEIKDKLDAVERVIVSEGLQHLHWQLLEMRAHLARSAGDAREEARFAAQAVAMRERITHGLPPDLRRSYLARSADFQLSRPRRTFNTSTLIQGREVREFVELLRKLNQQVPIQEALRNAISTLLDLTGFQRGMIVMAGEPRFQIAWDTRAGNVPPEDFQLPPKLLDRVLAAGEEIAGSDESLGLKYLIALPLANKGKVIGALYLDSAASSRRLSSTEIAMLRMLCDHVAFALENARLYTLSIEDQTTGLFNHTFFQKRLAEEIERSKRTNKPFALMIMDIDNFKTINDTFGHQTGTLLLQDFAKFLRSQLRSADVVATKDIARYGGDEFELLLPDTPLEGAVRVAQRIKENLGNTVFKYGETSISITSSMGVGVYPDDAKTAEEIFIETDKALYHSKRNGRNRFTTVAEMRQVGQPSLEKSGIILSRGGRQALQILDKIVDLIAEPQKMVDEALEHLVHLTRAERGFIIMQDGDTPRLVAKQGITNAELAPDKLMISFGVLDQVATLKKPLLIDNTYKNQKLAKRASVISMAPKSVICLPFMLKERLIGFLYLDSTVERKTFTDEDFMLCTLFANKANKYFGVALDYWRLREKAR